MLSSIIQQGVFNFSVNLVKYAKNGVFLFLSKNDFKWSSPLFNFTIKKPVNMGIL